MVFCPMKDCLINIDPDTLAAAGPFMGAALLMLFLQVGVVLRVSDKVTRLRLLHGSFIVQALALIGGMAWAFMHGT